MKNVFGIIVLISMVGCGKDRVKEIKGLDGNDGVSCYTESRPTGNFIVCGDSEFEVSDGQDGKDGVDGQDGKDGKDGVDGQDGSFDGYLEYVEVCPDIPGQYPEVLLYLDGQYMAFLTDNKWKEQRLVILDDGTYKTTDGRGVYFTISGSDLICPN